MKIIEVNDLPGALRTNVNVFRASMGKHKGAAGWTDTLYVRPKVILDARKVARYAKVCGFKKEQGVPMLLPHLEAFPLAMMFFGSGQFPFKAMGMVHLANRATLHKRIHVGDELRFEVQTGELFSHKKGQVMTLQARALRRGELVWDSTWTFLSTVVRNPVGPEYVSVLEDDALLSNQADFTVTLPLIRRYGKVSGDVNPIHMSNITAKLMGFRKAIAHGMWTKARALAILMPQEPVDYAEVNVEFKTPLFLPAKNVLWAHRSVSGANFEVRNAKGDRTHLRGQLKY